jgi:hypothetical protein
MSQPPKFFTSFPQIQILCVYWIPYHFTLLCDVEQRTMMNFIARIENISRENDRVGITFGFFLR